MENENSLLLRKFDATNTDAANEDELRRLLSAQIADMLQHRREFLFSLLYRMDVDEDKAAAALHPAADLPPHLGLTELVLARQQERNRTREQYKQPPVDEENEDISW